MIESFEKTMSKDPSSKGNFPGETSSMLIFSV